MHAAWECLHKSDKEIWHVGDPPSMLWKLLLRHHIQVGEKPFLLPKISNHKPVSHGKPVIKPAELIKSAR
ncbi:hypothetical protein Ccrd_004608 [Cynara cardunculus var. scolymus]|uniref:Uncharacterized protein n=1 Tax=Cynara cardunculus var. scolymus TaxID=59895 RepID=A0A124SCC6_CYNCS|nr:hypothetical protein Ccrd_004608 [Cynara cardunculus var. scolymus]